MESAVLQRGKFCFLSSSKCGISTKRERICLGEGMDDIIILYE